MKEIMKTLFPSWRLLFLLLVLFALPTMAQKPSSEEQKILSYVDTHKEDAVTLLEKLVNVESPTQNVAGVKQVGLILKSEFDTIGFQTKWIEMPAEMKRAGHLVAERTGTKGKKILLLGHLDTVLSGEKFRREGNRAYGTGASDMKAGDVVLLYALKALHNAGLLTDAFAGRGAGLSPVASDPLAPRKPHFDAP
mgnify:CR=1 FL=1